MRPSLARLPYCRLSGRCQARAPWRSIQGLTSCTQSPRSSALHPRR